MSSEVLPDLKYARTHEWVRVEGDVAVVGITDHAQQELTDIVFVELPKVGRKLEAGEACAVVESVKTASDIYAPVCGRIEEVNESLVSEPGLINSSPFRKGWFFKVRLSAPEDLEKLMDAAGYKAQIGQS